MPRRKLKVIEVRGTSQPTAMAPHWGGKVREVFAFGLILSALYALVSLLTYQPNDIPSLFWAPGQEGYASNKGGAIGASMAGFLLRYLGLTAYALAFFGLFWGVMILLRQEIHDVLAKVAGVALFLGAASTLLALGTPDGFEGSSLFRTATLPGLGGAYGNASRDLLVQYIGSFGAVLAMLLVLAVSMVLATDWMIYFGLIRLGRATTAAYSGVSGYVRRFQGAWAQMPPLLQAAASDARVRVPDVSGEGDPDEMPIRPDGSAGDPGHSGGVWRSAFQSFAEFFTGGGRSPVTIRNGPAPAEAADGATPGAAGAASSSPTPSPIPRERKATRRIRTGDEAAATGVATDESGSRNRATEPAAPTPQPPQPVSPSASGSDPRGTVSIEIAPTPATPVAPAQPSPTLPATPTAEATPADAAPAVSPTLEPDEEEEDLIDVVEGVVPAAPAAAVVFAPMEEDEEVEPAEPVAAPPKAASTSAPAAADGAHPPVTVNLGPKAAPPAVAPTPAAAPDRPARRETKPFQLPPMALLEDPVPTPLPTLERDIEQRIKCIEATLECFSVPARVVHVDRGPSITMYELELAPGIRVNKIIGMSDDLAIALKVPNVRIVAPIPGKSSIGIEVPNALKEAVRLKELVLGQDSHWKNFALPLFLGKDVSGMHVVRNLEEMPHLLVAGTTGSGKSVCLNTIILSLLLTRTPEDLKLILVDPKMVELSMFKDMPHLLSPVVTDMKRAPVVLDWVVRCMEERYDLMARAGVKKISTFNSLGEAKIRERLGVEPDVEVPTFLPRIVVVIDELADLMMVASKEVEFAITRLAQKSRAVGIHLVLATQRPSVDVITGLIKSNMPARIAFKVASGIDSRTILDQNGAERLLGKGDMLLSVPGSMELLRTQCTYVGDNEISEVVQYLKEQGTPVFDQDLVEVAEGEQITSGDQDELYAEAVKVVVETGRGSTSLLQRKLEIGYTRAARLIDFMAKDGIVGAYKGSKAREVLMTPDMFRARFVTADEH